MKLVVASNNQKKRKEIAAILGSLGIELVPAEETISVDVIEDADSFAGNARKKAEAFASANGLPALADDSGLCVDALGGAPGIYSSRYAGEDGSDAANNAKLLQALAGIDNRSAHFSCAIHLAYPDGRAPVTAEGHVDGMILSQPAGSSGFGYDPLFYCPELDKVFAEASAEEKASVSHRGRALRALAAGLNPA
ncbi:RdgB/HAM1 family non-canonical purine NTP pyrophosphatase [Mariprofundus ferrooxydans]|uniref:dITP/XTP pyrophosphatase n=1 Tax=Mariprofundus ferrooxydans PV-1 TaxID=314345 RepID=Q0EYZ5_9PROT|nr:RdgB/HAM1 family non-canonical purine NTP pyrophosphatase [Mariprofundus ferrooxydans]EAU54412.1 non-canonical purine NTP pyrophosphatase, RdgB/HAM1 family protein [Mariprofundus ferrooxydans PV-1]KON48343.1 purine NTP phosphatase [Mariprofundus ferrooxydans]